MTEEATAAAAPPALSATDTAAPDAAAATGERTRQRRKRKWDQPAEGTVSATGAMPGLFPMAAAGAFAGLGALSGTFPYMNYFPATTAIAAQSAAAQLTPSATVQQNAAAIVQKFNQDLASKGLLLQAKIQDELIAREITINDADPGVRYKLTKRQTQEDIQIKTGAVVITRGRYRPPNGPVEQEKPLYLHISAGVNLKDTAERIKAVDQAAAMVEEMLKQGQQPQVLVRSGLAGNATNGHVPTPVTANVFVGFEADPSFNLIGRIRGPNDQYINHIMTETGASVILRGRGSGNKEGALGEELRQPLHLAISSENPKNVEDAKTLAENLLGTIRADSFSHRLPPYQVPTTTPAVSTSTYQTPQQAPYQPSLSQSAYGGYYPSVGGVYPPPYSMNQAPIPFPPSSTVALPPTQPASTPVNLYSNMVSSTKVYGAVPPPKVLLGDQPAGLSEQAANIFAKAKTHVRIREKFSQSSTNDSTSSSLPTSVVSAANSSVSHPGYPAVALPFVTSPQILAPHLNGVSPAQFSLNQVSQSPQMPASGQTFVSSYSQAFASGQVQAPATSSYGGYSGLYPEAPPLQQVAQALQRPPLPVSVKPPTSSAVLATLTKAQSSSFQEKISEKQPAQRRKFQEFPVGGKDSSGEEQQGRRATLRSGLDASTLSQDPSPPGISMRPPASRSMPPPKPISSAEPSRSTSTSSLSPSHYVGPRQPDVYVAPPGTGLKLVEYGEEEEESLAGHVLAQSKPFSNGKPFWAP